MVVLSDKRSRDFWPRNPAGKSAAQLQGLEQILITLLVLSLEVIQQLSPAGYKTQKPTAGGEILAVAGQVLGKMINPPAEPDDLDVRAPRVRLVKSETVNLYCRFAHGVSCNSVAKT